MANAVTAVYQKQGINFKSTVFNIALSGSYAGPEVVTLTSAASNPSAATVTGPAGTPPLPPRITSCNVSGYTPDLVATATAGQYNLTLAAAAVAFNGAYAAGAKITVEVDHDLQGLDG
jgi:hypothetical protein